MRLLNTSTIELNWFLTEHLPDYAILSHKWGYDEVSYQDLTNPSESLHRKAGYQKIQACCKQASSDGFEYIWVDTCCIDKTSSSELSEAINSMYLWYQRAQVCYAYLVDVPSGEDHHRKDSAFARSRWFTRGWTLQEMLAPMSLTFFDQDWTEIGTKASLQTLISDLTGIDNQILLNNDAGDVSVAQKMSWASKRETTRVEDQAYCLMGIFGINMPLLYGEGENAFRRLQLEILKVSTDHSLFAWTGQGQERGLLAHSPSEFVNCGSVCEVNGNWAKSPYSMTNQGLCISLRLKWILDNSSYYDRPRECGTRVEVQILAILDCQREDQQDRDYTMLAVRLKETSGGTFVRINPSKIENLEAAWVRRAHQQEVCFSEQYLSGFNAVHGVDDPHRTYTFSVKTLTLHPNSGYALVQAFPDKWEGLGQGMRLDMDHRGSTGVLLFKKKGDNKGFLVILGMGKYNPWCDIVPDVYEESLLEAIKPYVDSTETDSKHTRKSLNLDRVSESLPGGSKAFVAVRKGKVDGEVQFLIDITVESGLSTTWNLPGGTEADLAKVSDIHLGD